MTEESKLFTGFEYHPDSLYIFEVDKSVHQSKREALSDAIERLLKKGGARKFLITDVTIKSIIELRAVDK